MLGIPLLRPWFARPARSVPEKAARAQPAAQSARGIGDRLGVRDHRDDGSAIAGLVVGLLLTLPVWALVVGLLLWLW